MITDIIDSDELNKDDVSMLLGLINEHSLHNENRIYIYGKRKITPNKKVVIEGMQREQADLKKLSGKLHAMLLNLEKAEK